MVLHIGNCSVGLVNQTDQIEMWFISCTDSDAGVKLENNTNRPISYGVNSPQKNKGRIRASAHLLIIWGLIFGLVGASTKYIQY